MLRNQKSKGRLSYPPKEQTEKERKRRYQRWYKRKNGLIRKSAKFHELFGDDIALIIRRGNGKYYAYFSSSRPEWPPSRKDIEKSYPLADLHSTSTEPQSNASED